ncbi:MAG: hypothetical protein IT364_20990, partial [Candidatus Hydrogenedentes bacterium]|nr:hypothetical protein [Candidatus Hydrogenedentota bacterium]
MLCMAFAQDGEGNEQFGGTMLAGKKGGNMTKDRLVFTGWLYIFGAASLLPILIMRIILLRADFPWSMCALVITFFSGGLSMYLWLTLRQMLAECYRFTSADNAILGILVLVVLGCIYAVAEVFIPGFSVGHKEPISILLTFVMLISGGVLNIMLGWEIRKLGDVLPLFRTYGTLRLVGGVFLCSLLLAPLAVVILIVAEVYAALIFWE